MPFSEPTDRYQLFKLDRDDYERWQELPPGYGFMEEIDRDGERKLLQSEFPHWEIPFNRQLEGLSDGGVICVGYEGEVVAISYCCEVNELGLEDYAQIHYAAVAPAHRGKKLLAAMVTEMFRRFDLKGGYFYVDREGHQPMYERWGGNLEGEKPKLESEAPAPARSERLRGYLSGIRRKLPL
jgi:hypothetical protein